MTSVIPSVGQLSRTLAHGTGLDCLFLTVQCCLKRILPRIRCSTQVTAGSYTLAVKEVVKLQWQLVLLPFQVLPALSCFNCLKSPLPREGNLLRPEQAYYLRICRLRRSVYLLR